MIWKETPVSNATTLAAIERMAPEATAEFVALIARLHSDDARSLQLHQMENETADRGREMLRLALQSHAQARGDGDVGPSLYAESWPTNGEEEEAPGDLVVLSHRRNHSRKYKSRFGWIDIDRLGYGSRGEVSIHPLDEDLSLPARRTGYPVQKEICTEVARGPYQEATRALERQGISVAVANVDKIAQDAAVDFEDFYAQTTPCPDEETSEIVVAAVDCKGVRIRNLPDTTPSKDPKRSAKKRMATVAAVYTIAPFVRTPEDIVKELRPKRHLQVVSPRPRPEAKRVWASLERSKDDVFDEVATELDARDPYGIKTRIALTDGERALQDRALLRNLLLILDIFHVIERLWDLARVFHPNDEKLQGGWVSKRLLKILQGKVSEVVRGVRQSATKRNRKLSKAKRKIVAEATGYFMNNREFMRYDEYLAAGYPIGSGAAEGACRHLINDRLERTGMSWSEEGAEAVLKLRAVEISGDTDVYWDFHIEKEHERLYGSRYWETTEEAA